MKAGVKCPQCHAKDQYCMFCNGSGQVTPDQAREWHKQNTEVKGNK